MKVSKHFVFIYLDKYLPTLKKIPIIPTAAFYTTLACIKFLNVMRERVRDRGKI